MTVRLFVSRLSKSVPAKEVEEFLAKLFPEAVHIQLLQGSHSGTHKGHAYVHFSDEATAADVLRRLGEGPTPTFHELSIHVKRASRLDTGENNLFIPQPLPPQLAHYAYSVCATVSSSVVDTLDGVVARCELSDGVTAVAFASEAKMTAALETCRENAAKCLPPLLPELLSSRIMRKRRRSDEDGGENHCRDDLNESRNSGVDSVNDGPRTLEGGADVVAAYERRGFVPLAPAVALTLLQDFMEGRGRVALKDQKGHMAVMTLPAHAMALE
ncbi:putative RNA-binding protein 34 [Trypanosoma cruzi]|uniref:RRM domain-containing protein n=2 Tax=Trypanosoma cruzi TaxID=5693 RepID=Q4D435_TRYCC|nr:hypothetical protein, conserved [Trypanosoma cruzi]EAN87290.1 hypothetical protein, conserved [Trypanosoma cruzi]PWU92451.1 putative RNA-binding protein 34 [Trypanosoma cruzi]|eukprot:XP_809141.1 hypothetical protein [Trypanosoma cruzi strain CL Brener]